MAFAPLIAAAASAGQSPPREAGERAFQKCYSCHDLAAGSDNLTGPSLHGILGRPVGAERGFAYSPAMERFAASHRVWTPELIDRFIADPETLVPGTSMAFAGIHDPEERAALIAYLRQASNGQP